jgi:predicted nicotinamide N-methyase
LNVIELGAGCGIVGVTIHTFHSNVSQMLLTDLPEASEILAKNLDDMPSSTRSITHEVLDWSAPLTPHVRETRWDLVLVADCTYNPSTTPHLVSTLRGIAEGSGQTSAATVVLLAMKVRHDSEMVCFDMLAEAGFVVRDKMALKVPTLPTEADEEIEVFLLTLKSPAGREPEEE